VYLTKNLEKTSRIWLILGWRQVAPHWRDSPHYTVVYTLTLAPKGALSGEIRSLIIFYDI